ncbi:MAG: hypothetical protein ACI8ZM_000185 [Crocinitomix sp.]|jgi:hypothetical protein
MKSIRLIGSIALLLFAILANAQSFNNYYPDNLSNDIAGYCNATFDAKSETYFLVEYDRQIDIAFNSALHVKKVDAAGNLIDHRYFVTDFMPYSGHYISGVQSQGDEIVVFVNRNVGYPHVHDVFIIRIKKDLTGIPTSKRLYLDGDDKSFNSMKINEVVQYGNQLLFTGSVFTRGDLNFPAEPSKLLMGFVNADGSVNYQIYQHNADRLEGLSLLPRAKANELYISIRFTRKDEKALENKDMPLIVKMRTFGTSFYLVWGKLYPDLRVDVSNYSSYNEGIEIPLIESFTEKSTPAFLARNEKTEDLVFVPFSRLTGDHVASAVRQIVLPEKIELIDAVKMNDTKNGLAVLFTRQEPYNLRNSESYLMTCPNLYQLLVNPKWHDLTSPSLTNAIQARKILIPAKGELAIAGLVNRVEYPLSGLYRASLMKSDDLSFDCVDYKKLKTPKLLEIINEKIALKLSNVEILEEEREIEQSVIVATYKYKLCGPIIDGGRAPSTDNNSTIGIELTVFPNPADHTVQIIIPQAETGTQQITIRNMMGQIVYQRVLSDMELNCTINTSHFSEGVYLLELSNDDQIVAQEKVIIAH